VEVAVGWGFTTRDPEEMYLDSELGEAAGEIPDEDLSTVATWGDGVDEGGNYSYLDDSTS